tara:strand:+ start:530 stop:733 length:204 start_codon:yes stop_codon:yes gene_type:complete
MVKRKIFHIGDLVSYIGHGTAEYMRDRTTGIVLGTMKGMVKVKWVSPQSDPAGIWYQPRVLKHLEKE